MVAASVPTTGVPTQIILLLAAFRLPVVLTIVCPPTVKLPTTFKLVILPTVVILGCTAVCSVPYILVPQIVFHWLVTLPRLYTALAVVNKLPDSISMLPFTTNGCPKL